MKATPDGFSLPNSNPSTSNPSSSEKPASRLPPKESNNQSNSGSTSGSSSVGPRGRDNPYANTRGTSAAKGTFWLFRPGGGGNVYGSGGSRRPGPRTNSGYEGVAVSGREAAEKAWFDGTLSDADRQWWESNLPGLRAKMVSPNFYGQWSAASAWKKAVAGAADSGLTPQEYAMSILGTFDGSSVPPINLPSPDPGGPGGGSRGGGGSGGSGGGGGGYGGGLTQVRNDTSVDITDPMTAKAMINDTISTFLGRAATDDEISSFTAALNAAERVNPSYSRSTATQSADGMTMDQSSTSWGGLDSAGKQQLMLDKLKPTAEYQAVQTDSVFRKALSALSGGGF